MILISPQKVFKVLALIILILGSADLAINALNSFTVHGNLWGVSRLFDLDNENNIPTWYSSVTLLICSALLMLITHHKKQQGDRFTKHWRGLSLIFLWLSIDEAASIHELLIELKNVLHTDGFLRFAWVIPASIFLVFLGLSYRKFLAALPQKTKRLFLLAAGAYVTGGLVMEMVGGKFLQVTGLQLPIPTNSGFLGLEMATILASEEILEMCGVAIFIYALLAFINREVNTVYLQFGEPRKVFKSEEVIRNSLPNLYPSAHIPYTTHDQDV